MRCEECGSPFIARREHARFCSARCRAKAYKAARTITPPQTPAVLARRPGGIQVAFRGARECAVMLLLDQGVSHEEAYRLADSRMRGYLSTRQRARLEARP